MFNVVLGLKTRLTKIPFKITLLFFTPPENNTLPFCYQIIVFIYALWTKVSSQTSELQIFLIMKCLLNTLMMLYLCDSLFSSNTFEIFYHSVDSGIFQAHSQIQRGVHWLACCKAGWQRCCFLAWGQFLFGMVCAFWWDSLELNATNLKAN